MLALVFVLKGYPSILRSLLDNVDGGGGGVVEVELEPVAIIIIVSVVAVILVFVVAIFLLLLVFVGRSGTGMRVVVVEVGAGVLIAIKLSLEVFPVETSIVFINSSSFPSSAFGSWSLVELEPESVLMLLVPKPEMIRTRNDGGRDCDWDGEDNDDGDGVPFSSCKCDSVFPVEAG